MVSCSREIQISKQLNEEADIFPDYQDVTIPCNIAPMCFQLNNAEGIETQLIVKGGDITFQVEGENGDFDIPMSKWKKLLDANKDKDVNSPSAKK